MLLSVLFLTLPLLHISRYHGCRPSQSDFSRWGLTLFFPDRRSYHQTLRVLKAALLFSPAHVQAALCASAGFAAGCLTIVSKTLLQGHAGLLRGFTHFSENDRESFGGPHPAGAANGSDNHSGQELEEDAYDPGKREPLYCNADRSSLWELCMLVHHYHPTVCKFASDLLVEETAIKHSGR